MTRPIRAPEEKKTFGLEPRLEGLYRVSAYFLKKSALNQLTPGAAGVVSRPASTRPGGLCATTFFSLSDDRGSHFGWVPDQEVDL